MSTHATYIAAMKRQVDDLNAQMTALEIKAKEAKEDARAKYKQEMANLRQQSDLAVPKFDELEASCESAWDAMVAKMEKLRDAWTHSFHYFKSQV